MIEINLVPDVKQELIRAQRQRTLVVSFSIIIGLIALGVVALLALYVFAFQTVRHTLADDAIERGRQQLSEVEDLSKVLTIQNQLSQINALNGDKKVESRLFDMLASVLPPKPNEVRISTLLLDNETKSLKFEGQTPTYDTLEVFKKTIDGAVVAYSQDGQEITEKLATEISISDVSYGESLDGRKVLRFTLSFVYPEVLFAADASNVTIKLTNAGNVTDSYLGIPRSIFVTEGDE